MRKQEREAINKRIKEVLKKDPELSIVQIRDRFHIGHRPAMKLKKEALREDR